MTIKALHKSLYRTFMFELIYISALLIFYKDLCKKIIMQSYRSIQMLSDDQIKRLLDIANVACHTGKVYNARVIYDAVLTIKPNHVPTRISLAFSHIVVDDFEVAEQMLNDVLKEIPADPDAVVMLGLNYLLSGNRNKAHEVLNPIGNDTSTPSGKLASDLLSVQL